MREDIVKLGSFTLFTLLILLITYCSGSSGSEETGQPQCIEGTGCKKNVDCNGGTCSGGKCKCESSGFCTTDKECGVGMCCDTWRNQCYVCVKDNEVLDIQDAMVDTIKDDIQPADTTFDTGQKDTGIKDTGIDEILDTGYDAGNLCENFHCDCGNYCVVVGNKAECKPGCLRSTDCCEWYYCDTNTKICKQNTICHSDQECAQNPVNKHCDVGDTFECKECLLNSHCDQAMGMFCEIVSKTCQKIQDACNGDCDYTRQFCSTKTNPPSCQPKNPDLCKSCSVTLKNCPSPLVCQPIDPLNPFKGGTCGVKCYSVEDCFGNTCDTQWHQCVCQ